MNRILRMGLVAMVVAAQSGMAQTTKVGTFDRPSIVIAFYGSPMWSAVLKGMLAERDKAKAAGDQKRVDELSKWGHDQQDLAHKQLAGEAPIDSILETMKPMFATVAVQAHVTTIVPEEPRPAGSVTAVDVTDLLLDQLQANAKTRQIVEQLRKTKPDLKGFR